MRTFFLHMALAATIAGAFLATLSLVDQRATTFKERWAPAADLPIALPQPKAKPKLPEIRTRYDDGTHCFRNGKRWCWPA